MLTYNHQRFVAQAIESVMMQETNFDYELVIGEDCSTDRTSDICTSYQKKYPDKIRLLRRERNLGLVQNFVQTFYNCKGKYIATISGDDYWTSPSKLQKQANFLDNHSDYAMCFTPTMCFFEDKSRKPQYSPPPDCKRDTFTIEDLLRGNPIGACSVMFRNGLFDSFPDWFFSLRIEDWPLHILNAQHGKIGYINEAMAAYRIHPNSIYSSHSLVEKMLWDVDFYKVINVHLNFKYQPLIREMLAQRHQSLAGEYLRTKDTANARRYAIESIKNLPRKAYPLKGYIIIGSLMIFAKSIVLSRGMRKGNSQ